MRTILVMALFAAGCDPVWMLRVEVRSADDVPIEGAAVGLICDGPVKPQSRAAHSGVGGVAEMSSVGYFPTCDVSVAAPGYQTAIIEYGDMCPDDRCRHGREIKAVLRESSYRSERTAR